MIKKSSVYGTIYDILESKDMASVILNKFSYLTNQNPPKVMFYDWG